MKASSCRYTVISTLSSFCCVSSVLLSGETRREQFRGPTGGICALPIASDLKGRTADDLLRITIREATTDHYIDKDLLTATTPVDPARYSENIGACKSGRRSPVFDALNHYSDVFDHETMMEKHHNTFPMSVVEDSSHKRLYMSMLWLSMKSKCFGYLHARRWDVVKWSERQGYVIHEVCCFFFIVEWDLS